MLGFFVLSALILCLLIAALIYQALGAKKDAERFPPPGRLVDVGGYRLHIDCMGKGSPTVVLESGIAAASLSWRLVQNGVAGFTRVCCYDRAGLAWSEPGPAPRSVEAIVEELHLLLTHAGIAGPYVLVGHSFGAFTARAYASMYPADLAGMVLIDPLHPSEWLEMSDKQERRLRGGVKLSRLGAVLAHVGVVRFCLALLGGGAAGVPRQFMKIFGPDATQLVGRIVGEVTKLPRDVWPALQALWCQPRCFHAMADHLASIPESAARVAAMSRSVGEVPLVVLCAGNRSPDQVAEDEALVRLSSHGRRAVAAESGHWIQLDRPDLVIEAICEVVLAVRQRQAERFSSSGSSWKAEVRR